MIAPISTLPCLLLRSNAVGASRGSVGSEHTGVPTAANEFSGYRSRPRSAETGGDFPSRLLSLDLLAWTFLDFLNSRPALVPGSLVPIVSCPVRRESSLLLSSALFCLLLSSSAAAAAFYLFLLSTFYFLLSTFYFSAFHFAFLFRFWLVRLRRLGGDDFSASPFASSRVRKRLPRLDPSARLVPTGRSLFHETGRGIRRPLDLPSPTGNQHSERRPSRRIHGRWERDLSPLVVDRRTKPRVERSLQRRN